ncbi:GntR family transcriptional regulator [uncultured Olegusella sp.]|uniref:GntR family transcriptional regulator n=1 Tax=uncultured Olegusella sp. TaxID=1979846 RepID=UPI00262FBDE8|nr:GntR family transcriptional regulator [uncultured Olegusella sp.]
MSVEKKVESIIQKDCPKPIYSQVIDYLKDNISSGLWKESERIPSEIELTETLQVSRGSIKKAISHLVKEGLLEQIQGKGTYVKAHDISFPLTEGLISFSETLKEQHIEFTTEIVSAEQLIANESIAKYLNIKPGDTYFRLERIRKVKDEPIMYIENNINCSIAPGIAGADYVNESFFSIIKKYSGHEVKYSNTSFLAKAADQHHAKYLEMETGSPVLQQVQTVFLDNDSIIEYAKVWLRSNRFTLGTVFQRRQDNHKLPA